MMKTTDKRVGDLEKDIKDSHKQFVIAKQILEGKDIGKYWVNGEALTKKEVKKKYDPDKRDDVLITFISYAKDWKGYTNRGRVK